MLRRLCLALLLLIVLPSPALAQSVAGSWALRLDGAIIFRFDVERDGQGWKGVWSRPTSFASDGDRFGSIVGPTVTLASSSGASIGGWVELTFPDARPGAVPDVFRFNLLGRDRAEMIYAGTGLAPYVLERVAADALLGPWEQGRVYRRPGLGPTRPVGPPAPERQGPPAPDRR